MWSHEFKLTYTVDITSFTISTRLDVLNTSDKAYTFQALLHTYFLVPSIHKVAVHGLKGTTYADKLKSGAEVVELRDSISFLGETDSVYKATPATCRIIGEDVGISIHRSSSSSRSDFVVWNP